MAAGPAVAAVLAVEVLVADGKRLQETEIKKLEQLIAEVETKTEAEIVVAVAAQSTFTSHVLTILLLAWLSVFSVIWGILHQHVLPQEELILLALFLIGIALCFWVCRWDFAKRVLTSNWAEQASVEQRAEIEFYRRIVDKTVNKTGVLIYLSLMERRAVILSDKSVAAKVSKEVWKLILDRSMSQIPSLGLHQCLYTAVSECGAILVREFPAKCPKNPDEIQNQIVFL